MAQLLRQARIRHAARGDEAANAQYCHGKSAFAGLWTGKVGLQQFEQLLQHVLVGRLHSLSAPCNVGRQADQRTTALTVVEMVEREVGVDDSLSAHLVRIASR